MLAVYSLCALLVAGQPAPAGEASVEARSLDQLIESFFDTADAKARRHIVDEIAVRAVGDIPTVVAALQHARLWSPIEPREGSRSLELPSGGVIEARYRLPPDYDATQAVPLILVANDANASQAINKFAASLGELANRYILVCPLRWPGATFNHPAHEAVQFHEMVVAIRRAFHTDTDRWYVFGNGAAGDAAWLAVILHRDVFAALLACNGYPKMPQAEHLYPILLPNLADTRVLTVWHRPRPDEASARSAAVAAHNHAVMDLARHRFLGLTGIETSPADGETPWPSREKLDELLSARRPPIPANARHWFRYAGQGGVGSLLQTRYRGDEWVAQQLSILPSPSVDGDSYVADVLKNHLAFLGYRRDGTTYRLETRNCARVTLSIPLAVLASECGVTVYCNDVLRYDKLVVPSLHTMLENAYATWDFQRPVAAELSFSIGRDQP